MLSFVIKIILLIIHNFTTNILISKKIFNLKANKIDLYLKALLY